MSEQELQALRVRIDNLDERILELISDRARCAEEVARVKMKELKEGESPVFYRPEREAQVLKRIMERNKGPLGNEEMARLFREIMSSCLALENPLKVAYLGPEGTFSQAAAMKHFGHAVISVPMAAIDEVFREVAAGAVNFGVVPVENSTEGAINHTLDSFLEHDMVICGEVELRVHQYLLSRSGHVEDIERVYAHPQALAQTAGWLRTYLPKAERIPVSSNAEGARRARNADDAAAVAGESAGRVYGLKTVAGPIEDRSDNTTRFLVLGRESFPPSGHDRTSLLVFIRDRPGALYGVLEPLARRGISMNRIESRPAHGHLWQYAFFIDVAGHRDESPLKDALDEIAGKGDEVRVLGSYPVAIL